MTQRTILLNFHGENGPAEGGIIIESYVIIPVILLC